jgi:hypothetical protein
VIVNGKATRIDETHEREAGAAKAHAREELTKVKQLKRGLCWMRFSVMSWQS